MTRIFIKFLIRLYFSSFEELIWSVFHYFEVNIHAHHFSIFFLYESQLNFDAPSFPHLLTFEISTYLLIVEISS